MLPRIGEERLTQKVVPRVDPLRSVFTTECPISVAKDPRGAEQHVFLRVAPTLESRIGDATGTPEIATQLTSIEMASAVVFRKPVGSDDPEIGARNLGTARIQYAVLGLNSNLTDAVQHTQHALVDRLRPIVHQRNGASK